MSLDATVGSPTFNCYATVDEADAYFEDRLYASSSWQTFGNKEQGLITCSQILDWYIKWKGYKTDATQSMEWPRSNVYIENGVIDNTIIPPTVKIALFELTYSFITQDRTEDNPLSGFESLKVSSLHLKVSNKQSTNESSKTAKEVIPEKVWKILKDYYNKSSIGSIRLIRG